MTAPAQASTAQESTAQESTAQESTAQASTAPASGSLEERIRRLEDRQEILQSLVDYGELLDTRDLDAWAELWAEDGEFEMSTGRLAKGRQAIKDMLAAVIAGSTESVLHMEINPRITLDGDQASSTMLY